jgi:hypothetical protein
MEVRILKGLGARLARPLKEGSIAGCGLLVGSPDQKRTGRGPVPLKATAPSSERELVRFRFGNGVNAAGVLGYDGTHESLPRMLTLVYSYFN